MGGEPARRVAGNTLPELAIVIVAGVGVGREPFLDGEGIAAGVVKRQQAIGTAHGKCAAIGRQENVRPRCAGGQRDAQRREREAAPTQRRPKSPITSKPAVANSSGPVPNVVTWPTAIMTTRNAPPDCAAQVIGRSLLRERGALALRRTGSGFVMDSARPPNFDRPWAPQRLRAADTASPTPAQPAAARALPRDATPRQDDIEADQ